MSNESISSRPVLVIWATGDLGSRVVEHLLRAARPVRVMLRPGSDETRLPAGASVVHGDLLDPDSLDSALDGASAVLSTATCYGDWSRPDPRVDSDGNRNLVDAAARSGLDRVVFTSVLAAEKANAVEPFWQKHLTEQYLQASGIPFIALRSGTIIGGRHDFWARDLARGRLTAMTAPDAKMSFVHVEDLARYLAAAVEAPSPPQPRIDVGIEPASYLELAPLFSELLGREIKLRAMPWPLVARSMRLVGLVSPKIRHFRSLMAFLASGAYTANPAAAQLLLGDTPSLRGTLERYLENLDAPPAARPDQTQEQKVPA